MFCSKCYVFLLWYGFCPQICGEDQKIKKVLHRKILGCLITFTQSVLLFHRKKGFVVTCFWAKVFWSSYTSTDPAQRGGHSGAVPPKWLLLPPKRKLSPPSEDCAPKKLTGLGLLEITRFRSEKTFEVLISAGKSLRISVKTFFFGDHLSSDGKTFQFLIAAGKSLWIFGLHLVDLIQTGINFSCPRAPLEFT